MDSDNDPESAYLPGKDGMQSGDKAQARVASLLELRVGDGPLIEVQPDYRLALERTPQSMVVSWEEDGQPLNTSIPITEFDLLLNEGRIVIER